MRPPEPVQVLELFPEERSALLGLLSGLTAAEWELPTACDGWSVKDVALHILGGDLGNISRRRDRARVGVIAPGEDLVAFVNRWNEQWVEATRRFSPRLIIDLLAFAGPQLFDYFASLNLTATGGAVSWAGPERAPVWLDVAREYTEHWLHQQHIRDATGKPGIADRRFLAPVFATFVYALPHTFRDTVAAPGTVVQLHIDGDAGGDWAIAREAGRWTLYTGTAEKPDTRVDVDQSVAWRLFTRGMSREDAERAISIRGDKRLGLQVLDAVAIIA